METIGYEGSVVDFHMPKAIEYPVIVSRCLPDKSNLPIGRIYQNHGDGEGPVIYILADNNGEEISPPTTDWSMVENNFEKYAKHHARLEREAALMELANRGLEVKKVRAYKEIKIKQLDR